MRLSFLEKKNQKPQHISIHLAHVWTLAHVCTLIAELQVFKFQN